MGIKTEDGVSADGIVGEEALTNLQEDSEGKSIVPTLLRPPVHS